VAGASDGAALLEVPDDLVRAAISGDRTAVTRLRPAMRLVGGSGGTMAGLVRELGAGCVIGVDCGARPDPRATVTGLLGDGTDPTDLRIDGSQVGAGYGTFTENVRAALATTARDEGIYLDPTYTGRAMAALLSGSVPHGDRVVFLHSGGLPGLFGHPQI
jgi:D-cysteine desulfhydrase